MNLSWDEVTQNPDFAQQSSDEQFKIAQDYFVEVVAPQVDPAEHDAAWSEFYDYTKSVQPSPVEAPAPVEESSPSALDVAGSAISTGALGIVKSAYETPKTIGRFYDYLNTFNPLMSDADREKYSATKIADAIGSTRKAEEVGQWIDKLNSTDTGKDVAKRYANADAALSTLLEEGDPSELASVLSDPKTWIAAVGQAVPSLVAMYASGGSLGFAMWLEGASQASSAYDFEKRTGQKVSDEEFSSAVLQSGLIGGLLEKVGYDKVFKPSAVGGSVAKEFAKRGTAEAATEVAQNTSSNLATKMYVDPTQSLSEGGVVSAMGGFGAGGGMGLAASTAQPKVKDHVDGTPSLAPVENPDVELDNIVTSLAAEAEALQVENAALGEQAIPEQVDAVDSINATLDTVSSVNGDTLSPVAAPRSKAAKKFTQDEKSLVDSLANDDYFILTAENPNAKPATPEANAKNMELLHSKLAEMGLEPVPVKGNYDGAENSLLVPNLTKAQAIELGKEFGQESVVGAKGLIYQDGSMNPSSGKPSAAPDADNYYSEITMADGSVVKFQIPIDFDTTVMASTAKLGDIEVPTNEQGNIQLTHRSRKEGLKEIDPSFYGTGLTGAEAKRQKEDPKGFVDRTYYGIESGTEADYVVEDNLGDNKYNVDVDPTKLYDLMGDPDGLKAKAKMGQVTDINKYESLIKDAGYAGYWANDKSLGLVVAGFDKVKPGEVLGGAKDVADQAAEVSAELQKDTLDPSLEKLSTSISTYLKEDTAEFTQGELKDAPVVDAVAEFFGKEVTVFKDERSKESKAKLSFNGLIHRDAPDTIYINEDSENPALSVFGHEFFHTVVLKDKAVRKVVAEQLRPLLGESVIKSMTSQLDKATSKEGKDSLSDAQVMEELSADAMGDAMLTESFWSKVAESDIGVFNKLVLKVKAMVGKFKKSVGIKNLHRYKDFDRIVDVMAKVAIKARQDLVQQESKSDLVQEASTQQIMDANKVTQPLQQGAVYEVTSDTIQPDAKVEGKGTIKPRVRLKKIGKIATGMTNVTTATDAAHVTADLRKSPQEALVAIVTDKDGEILTVIEHSKGTISSSPVQLGALAGSIVAVPNAANAWLSHNHPGGTAQLSGADVTLAQQLAKLTKAAGVKTHDIIAVTPGGKFASAFQKDASILPKARTKSVDLTVRRIKSIAKGEQITSPDAGKDAAAKYSGGKSGVLLVDFAHKVVGYVQVDIEDMRNMSGTKAAKDYIAALHTTNASKQIVVLEQDGSAASEAAMINMMGLGNAAGTDTLDVVDLSGDKSRAELGLLPPTDSSAFFSRMKEENKQAKAKGLPMRKPARMKRAKDMGFDTSKVWYHGTSFDITAFDMDRSEEYSGSFVYVTDSPRQAELFAEFSNERFDRLHGDEEKAENVIPLLVKAENSFDYENISDQFISMLKYHKGYFEGLEDDITSGDWVTIESAAVQDTIRDMKYDSFYAFEDGHKNLAVFNPNQLRSVHAAFDPDWAAHDDLMFSRKEEAPRFYSQLGRVLDSKLPGKGTPASYKQVINSFANKGEFKKEDLEWSGLNEWLGTKGTDKITKQDVAEFLNNNELVLEDVVLRDVDDYTPSDEDIRALLDDEVGEGMSREDAIDQLRNDYMLGDNAGAAEFSSWQLGGEKENYREILITLPLPGKEEVVKAKATMAKFNEVFGDGKGVSLELTREYNAAIDVMDKFKADESKAYTSPHFAQKNIVAHARVNDRVLPNGENTLFLEEIQSDWHQEGRKKGYEPRDKAKLEQRKAEIEALGRDATEEQKAEWADVMNQLQPQKSQVPNAPFKDTKTWSMLAFKSMIKEAAAKGMDSISWTTGEQQAARYDLSKQVQRISWTKVGDDSYNMFVYPKEGNQIEKLGVSIDEIGDFVGKDVATKIGKGEGHEVGAPAGTGELEGGDLSVGGEGMKAFYDKMLVSTVNKYVKKWGAKVGMADLELLKGKPTDYADFNEWKAAPDKSTVKVHNLKITDKMREAALAGEQPLFSRTYESPEQEAAVKKLAGSPKTATATLRQVIADKFATFRQSNLDQFDSIKSKLNSPRAWMMAHLTKSHTNATAALINNGSIHLKDNVVQVRNGTKGLTDILKPLQGEHDNFLQWVAAHRAENINSKSEAAEARLKAEKGKLAPAEIKALQAKADVKERFMTKREIEILKRLNEGTLPDGTNRKDAYAQALKEFEALHNSVVDVAVSTSLVNKDEAAMWREEGFYVPFYRELADTKDSKKVQGPRGGNQLVRQKAYEHMKGADAPLADLLSNTLMNWDHLISASLNNQAGLFTVNAAIGMGAAEAITSAAKGDDSIYLRVNGKEAWYNIKEPMVLEALTALNTQHLDNMAINTASTFKRMLTVGVTASPEFKIRNLIRDTLHIIAVTPISLNFAKNIRDGWKATKPGSDFMVQLEAGGGAFTDSGYINGNDPVAMNRMVKLGKNTDNIILNTKDWIVGVWDKYQAFGARLENLNRAALATQLDKAGTDKLTMMFESRDVLDFTRTGSSDTIRLFARIVPFLNARMQGLDKMYRAGADPELKARMATVVGAYSMMSVALFLAMKDDDDYKDEEDWVRETYHTFKLSRITGGAVLGPVVDGKEVMIYIPRPFEVGAIASMAERAAEFAINDEVHGDLFAERLLWTIKHTFAMDPTPQIVKPALELYANRSAFTGRPIESLGMQNLPTEERKRAWTSSTAIAATDAYNSIVWDDVKLSPIQMEHLVRGYFGWAGQTVLFGVDQIVDPIVDKAEAPTTRIDKYPVIKTLFRQLPAEHTRWATEFYDNVSELSEINASIRNYKKTLGEPDKAKAVREENKAKLKHSRRYGRASRKASKMRRKIGLITRSKSLSAQEKREKIDVLNQDISNLFKGVVANSKDAFE